MTAVTDWIPPLAEGFVVTLQLAALASAFAIPVAAVVAILSISPSIPGRAFARGYVEVFRSIPILALLIFLYYGLGAWANRLDISAFSLAVAALTLAEAAYLAEIFRGALQSIAPTQWDAGASIGLGWSSTLRRVVLPQAVPAALPGTVNMVIAIIKDSSLASLVAVNEITLAANQLVSITFQPLPVYALLALFYLALIIPLSFAARRVERAVAKAIISGGGEGADGRPRSLVGRALGRWI